MTCEVSFIKLLYYESSVHHNWILLSCTGTNIRKTSDCFIQWRDTDDGEYPICVHVSQQGLMSIAKWCEGASKCIHVLSNGSLQNSLYGFQIQNWNSENYRFFVYGVNHMEFPAGIKYSDYHIRSFGGVANNANATTHRTLTNIPAICSSRCFMALIS